jgi:hypothetical protein
MLLLASAQVGNQGASRDVPRLWNFLFRTYYSHRRRHGRHSRRSEPGIGSRLEPLDNIRLLSARNMHPVGLLEGGQRQTLPTASGNLQMAQLTRP